MNGQQTQQAYSAADEGADKAAARRRKAPSERALGAMAVTLVTMLLLLSGWIELGAARHGDGMADPIPAVVESTSPTPYFPDGYVNKATEPEKQYPTF
jgi:hypothetical protein